MALTKVDARLLTGAIVADDNGNVGVGVTPSAWQTGTKAFQMDACAIWARGATNGTELVTNGYFNGTAYLYTNNGTAARYRQAAGHEWYTAPSGTAGNAITFTQVMGVDAFGQQQTFIPGASLMADYGCRAWVNFNGTGTVAIRESGNVSSITDNGTAIFTVNFANAMPDVNYAALVSCKGSASDGRGFASLSNAGATYSTTAVQIVTYLVTTGTDSSLVNVSIFR